MVEACEYDRTFLRLAPRAAIVTNVEADHLDVYGTLQAVIEPRAVPVGGGEAGVLARTVDDGLRQCVPHARALGVRGRLTDDLQREGAREHGGSVMAGAHAERIRVLELL